LHCIGGINWGVSQQLEDLDFAEDIYMLSHTFNKMYTRLKDLKNIGKTVGLKIKCEKTKSLRISAACNKKFQIRGENVEEVEAKTYIHQANSAFIQLYKIWEAKEISTATKLGIFGPVLSQFCAGCETWKCTKTIFQYKQMLKKNLGLKRY
jgi:hypothetical protein